MLTSCFKSTTYLWFVLLGLGFVSSCKEINPFDTFSSRSVVKPQNISYQITNVYPHDRSAFTQGLEFVKGKLYEGTGLYGASSLRVVDLKTGVIEKKHMINAEEIFGEGITLLNSKLFQLTWQNNLVYVYNPDDITKVIKIHAWPREGWGITHNNTELIISDGTDKLYFVDPESFKVLRWIQVNSHQGAVHRLNELEFIDGFVYANVWYTDHIVKIDPANGNVVGIINCEGILAQHASSEAIKGSDVLNGIAWDSASKKMYITGKLWPILFELELNEPKIVTKKPSFVN